MTKQDPPTREDLLALGVASMRTIDLLLDRLRNCVVDERTGEIVRVEQWQHRWEEQGRMWQEVSR